MDVLKSRVNNINELIDNTEIYYSKRPINLNEKTTKALGEDALEIIKELQKNLVNIEPWTAKTIKETINKMAETSDRNLGKIAQPLRLALCSTMPAPGIFEVMKVLGKEETLGRLDDVL